MDVDEDVVRMESSSSVEWPLELTYDSRWACCLIAQGFLSIRG